jgi:hypothetical protein
MSGAGGLASKSYIEPPKVSAFEDLEQSASLPLEKFKRGLEMQKEDPNSEVSKDMRSLLGEDLKKAGIAVNLEGLSYNQLKDIYPNVSRMAERLEVSKLKQAEKKEADADKKEDKTKIAKNKFLNEEAARFAKSDAKKEFAVTEEALNGINNYIKNPTAIEAQSLKYSFPKIMDPRTGVKDYELRLLGLAGSALEKAKGYLTDFFKGTITPQKAKEFKDLVESKHRSNSERFKKDLGSAFERGKREGLSQKEVALGILGADDFDELYVRPMVKEYADKYYEGKVDFTRQLLIDKGAI